jgi:DNA-binding beta-propeller fold protein YncE
MLLLLVVACSRTSQQTETAPTQPAAKVKPTPTSAETTLPSGTLLVADKAKAELFVFHLPTREPIATLPTGRGPHEIAVSADGALAVVSNYGEQDPGNTLTVVDLAKNEVVRTIDLGEHQRPHGSRFRPGTHELVVTTEMSQHVLRVDVDRGEVVAAVPTQQPASHMVVLAPDGRRAYTTNIVAGTVSEVDLDAGKHLRTIEVAPMSEAIAITRDGSALWVGSNTAHTISVVDLEHGRVTDTLEAKGTPIRVELTPSQQHAVASAAEGGALHVFDVARREPIVSIDLPLPKGPVPPSPGNSSVPIGIAFASDTIAFVSLARAGEVAVVDLERAQLSTRIDAGDHPDGIAFTPS